MVLVLTSQNFDDPLFQFKNRQLVMLIVIKQLGLFLQAYVLLLDLSQHLSYYSYFSLNYYQYFLQRKKIDFNVNTRFYRFFEHEICVKNVDCSRRTKRDLESKPSETLSKQQVMSNSLVFWRNIILKLKTLYTFLKKLLPAQKGISFAQFRY